MEQAKKGSGLSPEEVERIKAAQLRHSAFDPGCEKLTPEEFINWHPVGGISWEERAQSMRERRAADPAFNALMEEIEREIQADEQEERARAMKAAGIMDTEQAAHAPGLAVSGK